MRHGLFAKAGWIRSVSPQGLLALIANWLPWLAIGAGLACALGFAVGFLVAPTDARHGDLFRIIYLHVPAAAVAFVIFAVVVVASGMGVLTRQPVASMFAAAIAPTGALFALLALWSGSLWGKPLSGHWWATDVRLVADLALLALFATMIAIHTAVEDVWVADRYAAIVAFAGSVVLVAVFVANAVWPESSADAAVRPPEMADVPARAMLGIALVTVGMLLYSGVAVLMRLRCVILERERQSEWVTLRGTEPQ